MSVLIKSSQIDVNSWYQKVTLTITNENSRAVDMNHAAISFTGAGHQDPWGNFGGTLKGDMPLTLSGMAQGTLDVNEIIINNSSELLLQPGESGSLFFSFAATQVPVKISTFTLTLASSAQDDTADDVEPEPEVPADDAADEVEPEPEPEPGPEAPADDTADEVEPEPEVPVNDGVIEGEILAITASTVNATSWYQRVTFTVTNLYSQSLDLNQLKLEFTASAHPDPYSPFSGSLLGNKPVTLGSDGGWPIEKNVITINNDGELRLAAGESADLQFYLSATQTPVTMSGLAATLAHDPGRQGKIVVQFPSLAESTTLKPMIDLLYPNAASQRFVGEWGQSLIIGDLSAGEYGITVLELCNDEMRITPAESALTLKLISGDDARTCQVVYQSPVQFASVRLNVDALEFIGAKMVVELWSEAGVCERTLTLPVGQIQLVTQLMAGHSYAICLQHTVINNQLITTLAQPTIFTPMQGQVKEVSVGFQKTEIDSHDFVDVQATILGLPKGVAPQRYLFCCGQYQYPLMLESDTRQQSLALRLAPGQYSVEVADIFVEGTPWRCELDAPLRLLKSVNNITLEFIQGVPLQVKGWPDYLAHGGVTVNAKEAVTLYRDVPFSALFKYDGFDGGGDPIPAAEVDVNGDGFLDYDSLPIHKTIPLVREIEQEADRSVMPVMVVYTANASGGSALSDLQNGQRLRNHFGNFITQCLAAQSYKDSNHAVPATFVLNPDFLGAMQQEPYGYTAVRKANSVPVNVQLAAAINALPSLPGFSAPLLPEFSNDLYGYVQAINYLVRQFAPDVAFGWQTNVWATGTADWVLRANADPVAQGTEIAKFINELGVYSGEYAPDFIAFDKFERDCFSPDALAHYGWNATCWFNYLGMVKQAAKDLHKPAMLWQIPGGHMPTVEEGTSKIAAAHFASGGSFFMGDSRIGCDLNTITSELLNTAVNSTTYGVATVGDFLRQDDGYDWGQMQALNLPDYNVFSVLWGGGSTVSITTIHSNGEDGGWLADKMVEYYAAPKYFK
ncbi:chitinase [Klebsiella sp. RHBSTW-00215]|uniref:chitinase n=1 Tax=Klebsiella sp. RHBSTW-00215 TaxID=2742640 RepID=UPI0015F41C32|nr:chitinase [Klebsiella sp. RHBSTW-00215]MBA7931906.1 chitinase [Klebsiella sp. RHBSTW-00215]